MVDPKVLATAGITSEAYKKKFDGPRAEYSAGVKKLLDLASQRIRDGVNYNLANARLWYAIDQAYDSSFYQVNYTLVRGLLDKNVSEAKILSAFRSWGLTHMITDVPCAGSCGTANCSCPPKKKLDLPTFFSVFVPLVQAYTKIRWARLFNQRDIYPVFKYEPLRMTRKNRLRTEIITDRVQRMAVDMGYRAMKRQVMFQDLLYSMCLQFPVESWFKVEHGTANGGTAVEREGIRYCTPHPSRTFCDLAHRPDTLNTDTGCEYAGYWHISRYRDVNGNSKYWNRDQMAFGGWDWTKDSSLWQSYRELYPCVMNFPISEGAGVGDLDRENKYAIYAAGSDDKSVVLTELFMRFSPKEYGLGDYDHPLWHRMTMANDITPVYVEPFAYRPVNYFGYDADGNRSMNAGMGVEIMPFQDLVGNYLTQYLLSVKSNLRNVVFFNTQAIAPEDIEAIQNLGDKAFTQINMLPFDKRKQFYAQVDQREAFVSVEFPKHNTGEILGAVRAVLDILERVLQFSAQELGQAASHEQSATETQLIAGNTDTRVSFTGGFIDDGLYAWKEQLYEGMMAYSSDDVLAQVGELNEQTRATLKELGFEVEDKGQNDGNEYKAGVIGKKSTLELDGIASTRDNADRVNSPAIGSALVQLIQAVTSNPDMVRTLGLKQIVQWFNYAGTLLGLPTDFKLTAKFDDPMEGQAEQAEDIQKQVAELAQNVVTQNLNQFTQALTKDIIAPIDAALKQLQSNDQQIVKREEAQEEGLAQALLGIKARLDELTNAIATIVAPAPPLANPNLPPEIIEPLIGVPEPPVNVNQIEQPALV